MDALFAFMMIVCVALILSTVSVPKCFIKWRGVPTNIWYLHAIFFGPYQMFQKILYAPKYAILVFGLSLITLIPIAAVFEMIQRHVQNKLWNKR